MIPISTLTTLSIEKAAKLVQNLVDLRDKRNVDLPEDISKSLESLLKAHTKFTKDIDQYMQTDNFEDEDNIEIVSTIVETCPEFLATKDKYTGRIPCHLAAEAASNSAHNYLLLFARLGLQHQIGGTDKRGSLLVETTYGDNALHHVIDPTVLDVLRKHSPSLFYTEDVKKYNLLHSAANCETLDLVKNYCSLDPSCLYKMDRHDRLPIHCSITRIKDVERKEIVQYLIQQSVSHSAPNNTIGGLFTTLSHNDTLVVNALVDKWGREEAWDLIERALSTNNNLDELPILHQTIRHTPQYFSEVINRFPNSGSVRDANDNNRLPIHVALESGMKTSIELTHLMKISQDKLREVDPVTKFPPFALAGMGIKSCDLRTIYRLRREYPEEVESCCDGIYHKRMKLNDSLFCGTKLY